MSPRPPSSGLFELPPDHLGLSDPSYLERRSRIAEIGAAYRPGGPIPDVTYTAEEDDLWRMVSTELTAKHQRLACRELVAASQELSLPTTRVPQLREVDERLDHLSRFRIRPVPGLVPTRTFYGSLAARTFSSTQYVRHPSVPFYTPEPDIVHEIIGHATMLASPTVADVYAAAGQASLRCESDDALAFFSRVFWFTMEFGVVRQGPDLLAFGAGLLSSFAEIEVFQGADIRPWDIGAMGTLDYDIRQYQPVLFAASSFEAMVEDLTTFFVAFDEDHYRRLASSAS